MLLHTKVNSSTVRFQQAERERDPEMRRQDMFLAAGKNRMVLDAQAVGK
jgi:hypothetical protein